MSDSPGDTSSIAFSDTLPFQERILAAHNAYRVAEGFAPYIRDYSLDQAAQGHAEAMVASARLSHKDCGDGDPWTRLKLVRFPFAYVGESIAWVACPAGGKSAISEEKIVEVLMNDFAHRANIMASCYNYMGFGMARSRNGETFYTFVYASALNPGESKPREPFNFSCQQSKVTRNPPECGLDVPAIMSTTWSHPARMGHNKPFSTAGLRDDVAGFVAEKDSDDKPVIEARDAIKMIDVKFGDKT